MRKFALVLLLAATAAVANDRTRTSMQSGGNTTPIHDHGLHGEGQIIAILDTGADWTSCYLAEPDGSRPPINTGSPSTGLGWQNVNPSRRKIIAYNLLYSCDQYPGAPGCDNPSLPQDMASPTNAFDNQGHGTHAATSAAGDKGTPIAHDTGDALATGAKLVIQDAGLIYDPSTRTFFGDACSSRPGVGCPVNITPILEQAYRQGARIHSNSWGDRQGAGSGAPPTANYHAASRDLDAFVHANPDMLVIFNNGILTTPNGGIDEGRMPPASSLSSPGSSKNVLQAGGTRGYDGRGDDQLANYSLVGPARDGRIKPDVVGPAWVQAGASTVFCAVSRTCLPNGCSTTSANGTSWASPTIAGAAALVRQYYTDGFYPSGTASSSSRMTPSAALLKASIIAAARPVLYRSNLSSRFDAEPVPSNEQGFGFPVLDDVLYFPGDARRLRVHDVPVSTGLTQGASFTTTIDVKPGMPLKAVLVWTDPPGRAVGTTDTTPQLVNDLDLRVVGPAGNTVHGNERLHPGQPDRLNNVEGVTIESPSSGRYTISVSAHRIAEGVRQGYALVLTGDFTSDPPRRRAVRR